MAIGNDGETLKEHCLCGIHVHTATKIVIWLQVVFLSLFLLLELACLTIVMSLPPQEVASIKGETIEKVEQDYQTIYINIAFDIILDAIMIFVCVSLLYGVSKRKPGFYWPYLIVILTLLVFSALIILIFVVVTINYYFGLAVHSNKDRTIEGAMILLVIDIAFVVLFALSYYFGFVIVRRSKALMDVEVYGPSPVSQPHQSSVYTTSAFEKV